MKIKDRAQSPQDKEIIINRLLAVWLKNPHLRLGQLLWPSLVNRDYFFDEDFPLIEYLEQQSNKTSS